MYVHDETTGAIRDSCVALWARGTMNVHEQWLTQAALFFGSLLLRDDGNLQEPKYL